MATFKQPPYAGVYGNMNFPEWKYREYPKHISTGPHGQYVVAKNEEEEEKILVTLQKEDDDAPPEQQILVADPEKEILISRAAELGVAINKKWSKLKIKSAVEDAEAAADALPVESSEAEVERDDEEYKLELIEKAKSLGIPANKVWGIKRLKKMIAEVE